MKIKRIDSGSNAIYKELSQLTGKKGIHKQKRALASGEKIVRELSRRKSESFFVFHSEHHPLFDSLQNTEAADKQLLVLQKDLFRELDVVGTNAPLLCTPVEEFSEWDPNATLQSQELLCALGDPSNLGAVIRSASAFGVRNIILLDECADPYLPKVTKAASGFNFFIDFKLGPSINDLEGTANLVALDMAGTPLRLAMQNRKTPFTRWLIGEEGQGIPRELHCERVTIPMNNDVESLNAAVSASILFYELNAVRGK